MRRTKPTAEPRRWSRERETRGRARGTAAYAADLTRGSPILNTPKGPDLFRPADTVAFRDTRELLAESRGQLTLARQALEDEWGAWTCYRDAQPSQKLEPTDLWLERLQRAEAMVEVVTAEVAALEAKITTVEVDRRPAALRAFAKAVRERRIVRRRDPETGVWNAYPIMPREDMALIQPEIEAWRAEQASP